MLQSAFINGAAVRNFDDIGSAAARHRHMDGAGKGRGSPLGIDHHIAGRHRGQIVSSLGSVLAGGRGVPADELIRGGNVGRPAGDVVQTACKRSLIFDARSIHNAVNIIELEVIEVTDIIELQTSI